MAISGIFFPRFLPPDISELGFGRAVGMMVIARGLLA
jgi:hypothetical protein